MERIVAMVRVGEHQEVWLSAFFLPESDFSGCIIL